MTSFKPRKPIAGFVVYDGPSMIDGSAIVAVLIKPRSLKRSNVKTGRMAQLYILQRDIHPIDAVANGGDVGICGDCRHRPTINDDGKAEGRTCYVNLGHGPSSVYRSLMAGNYPAIKPDMICTVIDPSWLIRMGAYGDPAALPLHIRKSVTSPAKGSTSYSHAWRRDDVTDSMASVDSLDEAHEAWGMGRRTFRVIADPSETIPGVEIACPASKEAGHRVKCEACMLCDPAKQAKSITIVVHGTGAKHFATV
jgi:hypothetical protein